MKFNRDEIIRVIKRENRKLNPMEIMNILKKNSSVDDLRDLMNELDSMYKDGYLRTGSGNTYFYNDKKENDLSDDLILGKLDVHDKGNAHLIMPNQDDIFIPRNNLKGACDKDYVAIKIVDKAKNEGRVVKIIKRSLGKGLGEIVNDNGRFYVKVLDNTLPYTVEVLDSDIDLVDGLIVHLEYVKDISKDRVLAKIDYVIGHKNAVGNGTQFAMIASEFDIRVGFPDDVLAEAEHISPFETEEDIIKAIKEGRVDLRGETNVTIDGKDTKDIDDAINQIYLPNGNSLQTVPIADVSDKVKFGSALWNHAASVGNSYYWGNKVNPMLPIQLSNGVCSLNPNEDRFTVVTEYELDNAGNIINPNVYLAVIRSKQKMNYDAVQDIIEGKYTEDTKDYVTLKYTVKEKESVEDIAFKYNLTEEELLEYNKREDFVSGKEINVPTRQYIRNHYVTYKIIESALHRRGKIDFEGIEPKYIFDENDKVIDIVPRVQRDAEKIIECKMIYANEAFAMFMTSKLSEMINGFIPFVFRTHGEPNPKKIEEFLNMLAVFGITLPFSVDSENITSKQVQQILDFLRDKSNFSAFNDKLLRCMQKARYTPENIGHFGIASKLYCHFTSPIRRMADLLVHTLFKVFVVEKQIDSKTLRFWGDYLNDICEKISECEVNSEKCEYAINDYLNATYMEDKIGVQFEATIDGLMSGGFFARTDKLVDGRVDFYLDEKDAEELSHLESQEEMYNYIETHKKVFSGAYDYNEKLYGYTRNGRVVLRYGDKVLVCCTGSHPDRREVDFAYVRKL